MAHPERHVQPSKPIPLAAAATVILALATAPFLHAQPPSQPAYTIQARVPLTIVDVVVTDSKGHPVHGLQQSDFTVLEDNQPVSPNSFEEHRSGQTPAVAPATLNLPPNTFTNANSVTPSSSAINVLLLDSLNTPLQTQQVVVKRMLDFAARMRPGTRIAVFTLTTRLSIVQGFTTDPELVKAALNSPKNMAQFAPLEDPFQDIANTDNLHCMPLIEHKSSRGKYTMTAMRQLARYLEGMPGRKNLIWFGGSFPLSDTCTDIYGTFDYDYSEEMKSTTDLLARAHVSAFPIDPRALDALAQGNRLVIEKQNLEHLTMESIAEQTGGTATYTSNDFAGVTEQAIDTGANFYTLTYTPPNEELDSRFRTIKVKVSKPDLHVTYRNGYYAIAPNETRSGKKIEQVTPMQAAMMRGALDATQILFKVRIAPSPTDDKLSPDNQPDPKLMHPPYRHLSIAYVIDIHGIDFAPSPDANFRGGFEYGVRVYNTDGDEILNSVSKTVTPVLPPAVYRSMLSGGANAHQEIDLPATGDFILRIAVHDLSTDHVGAIEVPTASITSTPATK